MEVEHTARPSWKDLIENSGSESFTIRTGTIAIAYALVDRHLREILQEDGRDEDGEWRPFIQRVEIALRDRMSKSTIPPILDTTRRALNRRNSLVHSTKLGNGKICFPVRLAPRSCYDTVMTFRNLYVYLGNIEDQKTSTTIKLEVHAILDATAFPTLAEASRSDSPFARVGAVVLAASIAEGELLSKTRAERASLPLLERLVAACRSDLIPKTYEAAIRTAVDTRNTCAHEGDVGSR